MKLGRKTIIAVTSLSFLLCTSWAQATTKLVLDTFDVNEGHFNLQPSYSGSSARVDGASTADRVTTDNPLEGAGHEKLVFKISGTSGAFRCRFLSGSGTPANNTPIITSGDPDGWIGFYLKTTQADLTVSIWIEGPSNNFASRKDVINDGQWHLYEWDLDDGSAGPDGWGDLSSGIVAGNAVVSDGSHTIDSIIFRSKAGAADFAQGQTLDSVFLDFVAVNPAGSIDLLLNEPCLGTPGVGGMTGPLQDGDTSVTVTGASTALKAANGDAIFVYADGVKIGELTNNFNTTNGSNVVPLYNPNPTPPPDGQVTLVKGQRITATQRINGQESCLPDPITGVVVGGGNGPVKLTLSIRDLAGLNGPLGADGGTGGKLVWVGADTSTGGSPQGIGFTPSGCWQTVEFRPATDKRLNFAGTGDGTANLDLNNRPWGEIEHLAVSIDSAAPNSGPYTIYIDDVENGAMGLMTGFESGETQNVDLNQVNVLFSTPNFSGTTANGLLAAPNVSIVTDEQHYNGARSLKLSWQFRTDDPASWVRLTAATNQGHPYQNPMIRLDMPIRMRILMLPTGTPTLAHPQITAQPVGFSDKCAGQSASFTVAATGENPVSYQWLKSADGIAPFAPIDGATNATYNFTVTNEDATALYRVEVKDTVTGCTVESNVVKVELTPVITQQPAPAFVCEGLPATFTVAVGTTPGTPTYQWYEDGVLLSDGGEISGATTATLKIDPVTASRHGKVYTVVVGNGCPTPLTATSAGAVLTVANTPAGVVAKPASGLVAQGSPASISVGGFTAEYFNLGTGATPVLPANAIPNLIRLDPLISFDWVDGTPDPAINVDHFIVRWQAKVLAPATDDYTFYTKTDDGVRLWINNTLVIDHWADMGNIEWCGPGTTSPGTCTVVPLTAGQVVDVRMEYYENAGNAAASLSWANSTMPKQVLSPLNVQWIRDGQPISNHTTLISTAALTGATAGEYMAQYVDPCSGATVMTPTVNLEIFADYDGDGLVTDTDVAWFLPCATGPDIPFTPVDPCKAWMDSDGDGDVDQTDFASLQRQINVIP